ncbi:MAG TPA: C2 family cysteine protease [Fimbriimonadaceae bacterium]|nr:C2 family cysteine protease [Fimbriimonadaceae bacterium]
MLGCLLSVAMLIQGQAAPPPPSFAQTVLKDFDAWDADHDGKLTQAEIDKAALNAQFKGQDAAALAALHTWLAATKDPVPDLTKDWFAGYKPVRFRVAKGTPAAEAKQERKAYAATPGSLQSAFSGGLRRLRKLGDGTLFDADGPTLADIRQGGLGDCYMLAPLGALVHRNPQDVRNMIHPDGNGYRVKFADGQEVHVGPLTDTELALGGASTKAGYWIRVVEKAYGSRKLTEGEAKIATDSMHGGNSGIAGRAFTGHKFSSIRLVGDFKKEIAPGSIDETMKRLRAEIPKAASDNRLIVAGTAKRDMPKSISPNHAYAVFGYDAATDRVQIWNPHGNDFTPKGEEGPVNGYKIEDGVFSMPLDMFVRTFSRILFEEK